MMSNNASFRPELIITCPHCDQQKDILSEDDEDSTILEFLCSNRWTEIEGREVTCRGCDETFSVSIVEY